MEILKFGGKSLGSSSALKNVLTIVQQKVNASPVCIVVSARGESTDILLNCIELAKRGEIFTFSWESFIHAQYIDGYTIKIEKELNQLKELLECVRKLEECSEKVKNDILAYGEWISAKVLWTILEKENLNFSLIDSRNLIHTRKIGKTDSPDEEISRQLTKSYFENLKAVKNTIITGFIARDKDSGNTTTLGRNGSNYTASLMANFLDAVKVTNYSHVDGIYTADPNLVSDAILIPELSYEEANELANFGMNVLHAKTILPLLEKNIPLELRNTFNLKSKGTLIASNSNGGIKALSVQKEQAIITLEGRGMLGMTGIDGRIFLRMKEAGINVGIISQGSSERNISFLVHKADAYHAKSLLLEEFKQDLKIRNVSKIEIVPNVSVISVVGQDLQAFEKAYRALVRNQAMPLLLNSTLTGKNVGLVVKNELLPKTANIIHSQIFGVHKHIHLAIFGIGTVGKTLIKQLLDTRQRILKKKGLDIRIIAIANSSKLYLDTCITARDWDKQIKENGIEDYELNDLFKFCDKFHLENLIAIDVTASNTFTQNYLKLIENGFDLVSANKIANTTSLQYYEKVRATLKKHNKTYLYETNVGAGLPLIDTIQLMHQSGEKFKRIRGVFSGSLSYIFNRFSKEEKSFAQIVKDAREKGYTEPDPREDLSGNDVGRKLLILARELDLPLEFSDVKIQSLIPENLKDISNEEFKDRLKEIDNVFNEKKTNLGKNEVFRYVGDLVTEKPHLEVSLVKVKNDSALGQISGSDSLFEIYTESYGDRPFIIQGAGAGAEVTARGVFGDILRIAGRI